MTAATAALNGMPDAGNPRIWFCEGKIASAKPRCGPLLCNAARAIATGALCLAAEVASADGTWRWTGAGEDALASNPANWEDGAGAATAPTIGADVVFDADGAEKPCTWDLDVALGSWTQDGYTNAVTIETFMPGKGAFEALRISGDATLKTGMWKSTSNWTATKKNVYLRTGTIRGAGSVQANGKDDIQTSSGGRVAIVLTAPDADFRQFDVVGQASAVCPSLKTESLRPRAGCGTVYAETPFGWTRIWRSDGGRAFRLFPAGRFCGIIAPCIRKDKASC